MRMGAVHPVKIAHAHQRRTKVRWNVIEFMEDLHDESVSG
jgi:hypothetical protein